MKAFITNNWKTTLAGAAAVFTALGHLLTALSAGDTSTILPDVMALATGIGLIFAKDSTGAK